MAYLRFVFNYESVSRENWFVCARASIFWHAVAAFIVSHIFLHPWFSWIFLLETGRHVVRWNFRSIDKLTRKRNETEPLQGSEPTFVAVDAASIGVRAGKFLGVRRIFAQISPNLPEKCLWDFCLQIFPTQRSWKHFWCDLQKRSSRVFLQTLGTVFWSQTTLGTVFWSQTTLGTVSWSQTTLGAVLPGFSRILLRFSGLLPDFHFSVILLGFVTNITFGDALASPAPPPPTPLAASNCFLYSATKCFLRHSLHHAF